MSIMSQLINKVISEMNVKTILAIAAGVVLAGGGSAFAIAHYFKTHRLKPEQRLKEISTVISSVTAKKDLVTACYYEDLVVSGKKSDLKETAERDWKGRIKNPNHEMVLVQGARVSAGINLNEMSKENFIVEGDSAIVITLPEPVIMGVVKDISEYDEFTHRGVWEFEQVQELLREQSADLEKNAVNSGLLDRAYENAMNLFTSFFTPFGYTVSFTPRSLPMPPVEATETPAEAGQTVEAGQANG